MSSDAFIGLDLGTSALKGVAISGASHVLSSARRSYPTERPAPGRAEQDPRAWSEGLHEVVASLAKDVPPSSWRGIGLSGMIPTLITVDTRGAPTGPALTWEDARAEEEGRSLREAFGAEELSRRTGQWVDGRYLLPMFRWIERNDPDRARATSAVLSAKDFLFSELTGAAATDPSTATGFGCYGLSDGAWIDELAGGVALPRVRPANETSLMTDTVAEELRLPRSLPVTLGAADSVASAFALGVRSTRECAYVWGTSTVILGVQPQPTTDAGHRYLVTPLAAGDAFGVEMDLLSAGAALGWTAGLLGLAGPGEVLELAEHSTPGANGTSFLPYLAFGEQGALWDPGLRGAISGLTVATTREDVARALVEAIVLESRRCIAVLDETAAAPHEIRATGAVASSPFFLRQLAGATGRPVLPVPLGSAAALGAAMLAMESSGIGARVPDGGEALEAEPGAAEFWNARMVGHDRSLQVLREQRSREPI
jgi:xylulokinase